MDELIKATYSFDEFLEKLEDSKVFNQEIAQLFGDLSMIELRIKDDKGVVYILQVTQGKPTLDVVIARCKHVQSKFATIKGTFKLEKTLKTILRELQSNAHEILDNLNDEYLDTY